MCRWTPLGLTDVKKLLQRRKLEQRALPEAMNRGFTRMNPKTNASRVWVFQDEISKAGHV